MNHALRDELLKLEGDDQAVRAELAADGTLFNGYHPRMAAVHRAHAARLREILSELGWPGEAMVGRDGAKAAWLIAQHSIGEPDFMRHCRHLLEEASARGEVPRWQFALMDDRIRVYEGRPQRYGSQLRGGPDGLEPYPIEDPGKVDQWRQELGLPPLAEIIARSRANPPPPPQDPAAKEAQERAWRRETGWIPCE
jgi:hypothetical protein